MGSNITGTGRSRCMQPWIPRPARCSEVHVILDNFATHKTDLVKHFLQHHPNVTLHFTPTYSSWLYQVEIWFSKLQRDVIDRGIFTSVADLKRKILRYIRLYQKTAKPFRWRYSDVTKRIPVW